MLKVKFTSQYGMGNGSIVVSATQVLVHIFNSICYEARMMRVLFLEVFDRWLHHQQCHCNVCG